MNKVIPIKKRVEEIDHCSGCHKEIICNEKYHQVVMKFDGYDKHIALCVNCYKAALNKGIQFNQVRKLK
jgi:hypothetical protein